MLDIKALILETFRSLEQNHFAVLDLPQDPMWQEPLIGVAAGDDPYGDFLKEHIGSFHWSPREAFALKYPDPPNAQDLRVVSMAFPQTGKTKAAQQKRRDFPSDNWLVSRGEWEPLMREFSGNLVAHLTQKGIRSVSIDLQPEFHWEHSARLGKASLWSHRHWAHAAGLGTFSLSEGLITEKGIAVRLTSLILEAPLQVTPKPYQGPYDWCLYYQDGSCGACISRCPINAITKAGHDKDLCGQFEEQAKDSLWPAHIDKGNYIFGCGLCQAAVPCQDRRPTKETP